MYKSGIQSLIRCRRSLHRIACVSSVSSANPRTSSFSDDHSDGGSASYRHALVFKKPTAVVYTRQLYNSVSLIGRVDRPVKVLHTEFGGFGVFTLLRVKDPRDSNRSFRIFLHMWDATARRCIEHLKPNDLIYVSGRLACHSRGGESGIYGLDYKVKVTEVNYIARSIEGIVSQASGESNTETASGEQDAWQQSEDRLYLWQVFFANPYEWWDNRKSKKNPRQPDFKHKDTCEALWLKPEDPPWISKQLYSLDSKMALHKTSARRQVSEWVYEG